MVNKDELRQRIDIVDLISRTVTLRKDGENFKGLCPLHADTNPSLTVYPKDQTWHCFGCDKHGDAFQWIMETQKIDFKTALAELQEQYGVPIVNQGNTAKQTVWDITDLDGKVIAQHIRRDLPGGKKTFIWKQADGKIGLANVKVETLPLYGLTKLLETPSDADIFIVEGEKCADALIQHGYCALGTVTGATSCPSESAFHPLVGRTGRVYLWPDNDGAGYSHMGKVASHLTALEIQPYLIRWAEAPPKGDAADYLASHNDILALTESAIPWSSGRSQAEAVAISEGKVQQGIPLLSGNTIKLEADDIRRERTGIHAKVSLYCDTTLLAWDTFNIQRNEERNRLAKSAADRLPEGLDALCDAVTLKGYLDQFAAKVWPSYLDSSMGKPLQGLSVLPRQSLILSPYIISEGGTILFAPAGSGKSYLALAMGVSIDAGIQTLWPCSQVPVLYINIERSASSLQRRLTLVNRALGLPQTRPMLFLNARGASLYDIQDQVKSTIDKYKVKVLILDSVSRAGMGSLVEDQAANRTIDVLNRLCPTWLAIGHCSRAESDHVFGSVHWDCGADVMVQMLTQEKGDTLGIGLQITKANDIAKGNLKSYALEFDFENLKTIRLAKPYEFGELALGKKLSPTQEVINYLLEKEEASASAIADGLGRNRSNISALLNNSSEFVKTSKDGRTQNWGLRSTEK